MDKPYQITVLNPGSTSTKIAVYHDENCVFQTSVTHSAAELARYRDIPEQLPYRKEMILQTLADQKIPIDKTDAFVAICTGLPPMSGGIFRVNSLMVDHARQGLGSRHPGNLGPILAKDLADTVGVNAYIVDASSVDEFRIEARLTGISDVLRTSRGHPLNQRAVAKKFAKDCNKKYDELSLIVVHLGGGISVTAHDHGLMVDTIDSTRGEGRMAPTRSGAIPAAPLIEMCFSGKYTKTQLLDRVQKIGGWVEHLGTSDGREVEQRIENGDKWAELIFDATVYQIAKDIGACAAVLSGNIDAILLTGGLAYSERLTESLKKRIGFLAPIHVYPGEIEMEALALSTLAVLEKKSIAKEYTGEPVFTGFEAWKEARAKGG